MWVRQQTDLPVACQCKHHLSQNVTPVPCPLTVPQLCVCIMCFTVVASVILPNVCPYTCAWCCVQGDRTQRRRSTRTAKRSFVEAQSAPGGVEAPRGDRKRVRIGLVNGQTGQHIIAALRKLEGVPGRPPPGTLLLAQDPKSLNRYLRPRPIQGHMHESTCPIFAARKVQGLNWNMYLTECCLAHYKPSVRR